MKILGIIVEYNPFHNGHFYHIQEAKKITGCDYDDGSLLHCKYKFIFPKEEFCKFCDSTKSFTDLEEHNLRFEQSLNNKI
jgi:hypothetical protein